MGSSRQNPDEVDVAQASDLNGGPGANGSGSNRETEFDEYAGARAAPGGVPSHAVPPSESAQVQPGAQQQVGVPHPGRSSNGSQAGQPDPVSAAASSGGPEPVDPSGVPQPPPGQPPSGTPEPVIGEGSPAGAVPQPGAAPQPGVAPPPGIAPQPGAAPPPVAPPPAAVPPGYPPGQAMPAQPPPGYPPPAGYSPPGYPPYERRGALYYWYEYRWLRWLTVLLAIALIALLVWLLFLKSDDSSTGSVKPGGGPVSTTEQDLVGLSQQVQQPIYWAGTMPGTNMEVAQTSNNYIYLRYLPPDAPKGDSSPDVPFVGTYPTIDAFRNLRNYARHTKGPEVPIQNGGIALRVPGSPTSVYFAYPHEDVQVEMYDPHPGRALNLVKSGTVRPVAGSEFPGTASSGVPPTTAP